VRGLIIDESVYTTMSFVELTSCGERNFSFARKPGADTRILSSELNMDLLNNTKIFHFGSLSLTEEPARSATFDAIRTAREFGAIISYDPNYRASLWRNETEAVSRMREVLPYVDIIKTSEEESLLLTGKTKPELAAADLIDSKITCAVVTLGAEGAIVRTNEGLSRAAAAECAAVDTTGAGDAFWGGFLFKLLESGKRPEELKLDEARDCAVFANACATLCVQKRGAIPAMPGWDETIRLYEKNR